MMLQSFTSASFLLFAIMMVMASSSAVLAIDRRFDDPTRGGLLRNFISQSEAIKKEGNNGNNGNNRDGETHGQHCNPSGNEPADQGCPEGHYCLLPGVSCSMNACIVLCAYFGLI